MELNERITLALIGTVMAVAWSVMRAKQLGEETPGKLGLVAQAGICFILLYLLFSVI